MVEKKFLKKIKKLNYTNQTGAKNEDYTTVVAKWVFNLFSLVRWSTIF